MMLASAIIYNILYLFVGPAAEPKSPPGRLKAESVPRLLSNLLQQGGEQRLSELQKGTPNRLKTLSREQNGRPRRETESFTF
jgi:hypothetical protein